jgi:hypothetical protein
MPTQRWNRRIAGFAGDEGASAHERKEDRVEDLLEDVLGYRFER